MTMHLFDSASNDPVGEEALGSSYCASPMAQPSPTHSWQGSSDGPIAGAAARPPLGCAPRLAGFSDNVHSYEPDLDTCRSRQRTVRQRSARDAGWPSLHLRQSQLPRRAARHRPGRLCHPPCLLPHRGARAGRRLPALRRLPPGCLRKLEGVARRRIGHRAGSCGKTSPNWMSSSSTPCGMTTIAGISPSLTGRGRRWARAIVHMRARQRTCTKHRCIG